MHTVGVVKKDFRVLGRGWLIENRLFTFRPLKSFSSHHRVMILGAHHPAFHINCCYLFSPSASKHKYPCKDSSSGMSLLAELIMLDPVSTRKMLRLGVAASHIPTTRLSEACSPPQFAIWANLWQEMCPSVEQRYWARSQYMRISLPPAPPPSSVLLSLPLPIYSPIALLFSVANGRCFSHSFFAVSPVTRLEQGKKRSSITVFDFDLLFEGFIGSCLFYHRIYHGQHVYEDKNIIY